MFLTAAQLLRKMHWILLIEYHTVLRDALASELNRQPDMEVVAHTGSLAEGRLALALGGINFGLVNPDLPDGDGLELVSELRNAQPRSIPVLVLITNLEPNEHDLALKAGASEVLSTVVSFEQVFLTIRRIAD
jgi:two-component system response regulator DevR